MVYKGYAGMSTDVIGRYRSMNDRTRNALFRVEMTLRNVLYITYAVPAERMRIHVPDALPLAVAGSDTAFISVVVLRSSEVRLNPLPFPRFNYNQLNIRTYVVDPVSGSHAVYFLKSGVTARFISLVTRISGIPWRLIELETDVNLKGEPNYYTARGKWQGNYRIEAQSRENHPVKPTFFETGKAAVNFLIRPLIGFVGEGGRVGRFTIRHPEVEPQDWVLKALDFPLLSELGVVDEPGSPHSVFYLPKAEFSIYLPPKRIK